MKLANALCGIGMQVTDRPSAPGALWHMQVVDVVYKYMCTQNSLDTKITCLRDRKKSCLWTIRLLFSKI